MNTKTNWAGNITYNAQRFHRPKTLDELRRIVLASPKMKVVGTGHSFNGIQNTTGDLISLEYMNQVLEIDVQRKTITVEGGIRFDEMCDELQSVGYALHNLASIAHFSAAGVCATAVHGSGDNNQNLSAAVTAIEMMTADGTVHWFSSQTHGEEFQGMVVSLGALGVVTKLKLSIVPTYEMRQYVYEGLSLSELQHNFDALFSCAYSVHIFTDWKDDCFNQIWVKYKVNRDGPSPTAKGNLFGATLAKQQMHLPGLPQLSYTDQLGIPGPWYERLVLTTVRPLSGNGLQSEFFVARENTWAAIKAISEIREMLAPHLLLAEVRTVAADSLWLSPCYGRASVALHFTWKTSREEDIHPVLALLEEKLQPFDARPHWAKLFVMSAKHVKSLYEKYPDFQRLQKKLDPTAKFVNGFLQSYLSQGKGENVLKEINNEEKDISDRK